MLEQELTIFGHNTFTPFFLHIEHFHNKSIDNAS